MTNVKNGEIEFIGQFTPGTDPKFWFLSPDGQSLVVSISGVADLVFLSPCGQYKQQKRSSDDCVMVKITAAKTLGKR